MQTNFSEMILQSATELDGFIAAKMESLTAETLDMMLTVPEIELPAADAELIEI